VCEDFVLDDGCVVIYVNVLDGESRYFCEKNATEGVGDCGVDTNEGERRVEFVIMVKSDLQVLAELFEVPSVVLTNVMAREVGGGNIV
jgi:hypothetical protein